MSLNPKGFAAVLLHPAGDRIELMGFTGFDARLVEFKVNRVGFERLIGRRHPPAEVPIAHRHQALFADNRRRIQRLSSVIAAWFHGPSWQRRRLLKSLMAAGE